jgi:hypothetical protein
MVSHFSLYSQSKYLIKDKEGFDFILTVTIDGDIINGSTRKNVLLDYASKFNYQLIKVATSLKHPEIISFNATLTNDHFEGTYDYLFSSYKIAGNIDADSISYSLFNKKNELYRSFIGEKIDNYTKKNYAKLAEEVIKITEENIFDPKIIHASKWSRYRKKMIAVASNMSDDLEFQIGFFALTRRLGFSHYYIVKNVTSSTEIEDTSSLQEIDKNIAILKIGSFFEKEEKIKPLLDIIEEKAYGNLIIDLRDNPGGYFEPVSLIANFLTDEIFISGFFPSRKWYEKFNRLPNKNDLDKFYMMNGDTPQTYSEYGFYIRTKGSEKKFKGDIYFLVNKKTGSTAEALTIGVKEYKLAKIAGEKTAGGLLSVKRFKIDEDIILFVPVNDFISYNGYRVDQKGIMPDIKTKKGKELEQLIDIIKRNNR